MKKAIIFRNLLTVFIALVLLFCFSLMVIIEIERSVSTENVIRIVKIYKERLTIEPIENGAVVPDSISSDTRLTVLKIDGEVLYDNYFYDKMENHINREEIINALNNTPQAVVRYSDTLNIKMLYYAEKTSGVNGDIIVRVAIPYSIMLDYFNSMLPVYILVIFIALIITYFVSSKLSESIIKPVNKIKNQIYSINSGKYNNLEYTNFSDLNEIIKEINITSKNLSFAFSKASYERNKMLYVLDSISEAIIAVDKKDDIIIINEYAKNLFEVNDEALLKNVSLLSDNDELINLFKYKDKIEKYKIDINFKTYNYSSKKLNDFDEDIKLIILADITDEAESEKLRSNFFANAGHELKTPITSIRGFSELLTLQTLDGKGKNYAEKINKESIRLFSLIEDMLTLSKLENKNTEIFKEMLNIEDVAKECVANLESQAILKNVSISITGKGKVFFDKGQLYEVLLNLTENAIKYNIEGGKIDIIIKDKEYPEIIIKDNGIGIEKQHLNRIFERFYRVDKGRSKKTGGTGLGLAIVKHILITNGAEISVQSKEGVGTTFTIKLAK